MAITVKELREWLEGFTAEQTVSIDEGGLILQETGVRSHYIEVGGDPTEDTDTSNPCPICGQCINLTGSVTENGRLIGSCGDAFTLEQWQS